MRIACLSNAAVVHTARWVGYFRARGHEVRLFSLEPGPAGLEATALPRAPLPDALRYPLALPALRRGLAAFDPDLVDAHYVPNYGLLGALAGRRPLAVTAWGSDLLLVGRLHPLRRLRARWVLRRADLVLADAENLGRAARALGAFPERVRVVPWGVDLDRFAPAAAREPGLLVSARMHEPLYDLPTLILALAPLMRARVDTRLVVAGDGSRRRELEALAAARLPAGRYEFVGRLGPEALAALLARAELYLSASRSDSTSLSLLEAMAAGAVPVVSDLEGNREWVEDGVGARLFPVGDVPAAARAVEAALADRAWRERARAHNRAVVEERGSWRRNMARIESEFLRLAGGDR